MKNRYLLIASRDPYASKDIDHCYELAANLRDEGRVVTLFLVQNGVLPARPSDLSGRLTALAERGVTVLADDFSLAERGIDGTRLAAGISPAPLDVVVDQLAAGVRTIWH